MGLTVHVHDIAHGCAAGRVRVRLERQDGLRWTPVTHALTDDAGEVVHDWGEHPGSATFRLVVEAGQFFASFGLAATQIEVSTVVRTSDPDDATHVSVLLTPVASVMLVGGVLS